MNQSKDTDEYKAYERRIEDLLLWLNAAYLQMLEEDKARGGWDDDRPHRDCLDPYGRMD